MNKPKIELSEHTLKVQTLRIMYPSGTKVVADRINTTTPVEGFIRWYEEVDDKRKISAYVDSIPVNPLSVHDPNGRIREQNMSKEVTVNPQIEELKVLFPSGTVVVAQAKTGIVTDKPIFVTGRLCWYKDGNNGFDKDVYAFINTAHDVEGYDGRCIDIDAFSVCLPEKTKETESTDTEDNTFTMLEGVYFNPQEVEILAQIMVEIAPEFLRNIMFQWIAQKLGSNVNAVNFLSKLQIVTKEVETEEETTEQP